MAKNNNYQNETKENQSVEPPKLKIKEVEIITCPKCKQALKLFKLHNTYICIDCNIEM